MFSDAEAVMICICMDGQWNCNFQSPGT